MKDVNDARLPKNVKIEMEVIAEKQKEIENV